ncbi:MAG: hypothetical protein CMJ89_07180 [Planctomycetes bacterium]|jgi:hypothetical protein|nr:hypothetical protein [Planctomycetota bacterium]
MRLQLRLLLAACLLSTAAFLLAPARSAPAFSKLGGDLAVAERSFRVFDNFADAQSNDNQTADANFPGFFGLEMAIWKGTIEWGTGHGDGSGDSTQAFLGSGNADFEPAWMGNTNGVGTTVDNIVSAIGSCGGGTLAFTESSFSIGWRIRFCDNRTWADGPGNTPSGQFDLQGVMAHEYGHALGLGHSGDGGATMFPSANSGSESERSINNDDIAGLQCIYGPRSADKPTITAAVFEPIARTLTISGNFFTSNDNDVWFTPAAITQTNGDPRVIVRGLNSSGGGSQITVQVPIEAGPGAIHVRIGETGHHSLSNSWPFEPVDPTGPLATATFFNGSGINPTCMGSTAPPVLGTNWEVVINAAGHPGGAGFSGLLIFSDSSIGPTIPAGELLVDLSSTHFQTAIVASGGSIDTISLPIPAQAGLLGRMGTAQGFTFSLAGGAVLCNAEMVTLGL